PVDIPERGRPPRSMEEIEPAIAPAARGRPPPGLPPSTPPWLRHAAAGVGPVDGRPVVAVIVDDLGLSRRRAAEIIDLPSPLTLAFLPYAAGVAEQAAAARRAGHELLVHLPMEPLGTDDPGPQALLTSLPDSEFRHRLRWGLARFDGYVGVNNHMGSRATADRRKMALVMQELSARGLLFVDSRTTPQSVAGAEARRRGVPHTGRDVFLDNVPDGGYIRARLRQVETIARRTGAAVAIGHPYPETVAALREWLATLESRGFSLVAVTAVVAQRLCRDGTRVAACRAYAALQTSRD
ncbi:MAG TPA: divergent polysaccharide deacetylase family protein, partial [Geminicoccaceae bacterium]|nr:divergent polysaccharide deacetylase family protein [Geminicoccaceae bacterium]